MSDLGDAWDSMWNDAGDAGRGDGCIVWFLIIGSIILAVFFILELFGIRAFEWLFNAFKWLFSLLDA